MTDEPRETASRRSRPAKPPLNRDVIVATALDLLTRDGLAGLSLRKVAAALDTGPASLYVYVDNLEALHALILDRALGDVVIPSDKDGTWRERLSGLLTSYLQVLYARPGLGQLAMMTMPTGPHALRLIEAMLALLLEGEVDPPRAAWAVDLLPLHFAAIAAEQDIRRSQSDPLGPIAKALEGAAPAVYPNIRALREELMSEDVSSRLRWTLDVLINGVLHTPREASRTRSRKKP